MGGLKRIMESTHIYQNGDKNQAKGLPVDSKLWHAQFSNHINRIIIHVKSHLESSSWLLIQLFKSDQRLP